MSDHEHEHVNAPIPHVMPTMFYLGVLGVLLVLTGVTVATAQVDLGVFNLPLAMVIATCKAAVVASMFMHLWWDSKLFSVVFICCLLFLSVFIVMTSSDLLTRSEVDPTRRNYSVRDERVQAYEAENPGKHLRPRLIKPEDQEEKLGKKLVDQDAEASH